MEALLFYIGGFVYNIIEILWRVYTHWTMFIVGGMCFVSMGLLNEYKFSWKDSLIKQSLISAVVIIIFEFVSGCIVNLWLGWNVWDYSNLPFNILGQVCIYFFFLWIPLSAFGIWLDDWIRYGVWLIFGKYFTDMEKRERPRYKIW